MNHESDRAPDNPFQSPSIDTGDDIQPTGPTAEALRRTRPWVFFLAVLGAIGMGFMALGMIGMGLGAGFAGGGGGALFAVLTLFYLAMIIGYAFPVVFMFKYCGRIRTFLAGGTVDQLNHALDAQRAVWKSIGIIVVVGIVLYVVMMIALVSAAPIIAPQPGPQPAAPAPVAPGL